jgi:hypothetical protein
MNTCRVFVPYGALGTGISDEAFANGIAMNPDIISVDGGSTDPGPYYLGNGKCKYAREALKTDTRKMIVGAHQLGIPITIGSCGTCGVDEGVDFMEDICREILEEEGFSAKITKIYTEQTKEEMKAKLAEGKIRPLGTRVDVTEDILDSCSHIVAASGVEPFIKALKDGADIVLCGRATDTAVLACMPIIKGCSEAAAWHGAKVCECGALCSTNPQNGGIFLTVDETGFEVQATAADSTCTPYTVSAHLLYENADPFHLVEPGVVIDTSRAVYTQLPGGKVRVENSGITKSDVYTMKLEGAGPAGYQTITLVGIRDRIIMKNPQDWLDRLAAFAQAKLDRLGFDRKRYSFLLRPYGWNAVYGGDVPEGYVPNEIGVLLTVTADEQALATQIAKVMNPLLLHFEVAKNRPTPSFAFPFSPAEVEKGRIYEFKLYHVVEMEDPLSMVRMSTAVVGKGGAN